MKKCLRSTQIKTGKDQNVCMLNTKIKANFVKDQNSGSFCEKQSQKPIIFLIISVKLTSVQTVKATVLHKFSHILNTESKH